MEKILLAMDSQNVNRNAIEFACYLAKLTNSMLSGMLLENIVLEEHIVIKQSGDLPFIDSVIVREANEDELWVKTREESAGVFNEIAAKNAVPAVIYLDKGNPATDIIAQTRFADILVVDAATSFKKLREAQPTPFVKSMLQDAECPVVIAPDKVNNIDNIVFCYLGNKTSMFAIKQFSYLFPEYKNRPAKVICLGNVPEFDQEAEALTNWLSYHYSNVEFLIPEEDAAGAFFDYLMEKQNDFIVMGSYGKGLLAKFFEDVNDGRISETTRLPIFVAHN